MSKPKTILLVEDEIPSAEMLTAFLEMNDFRVLVANDGNRALEILSRSASEVDLAILDIMVPGADGRQICKFIREHSILNSIPVIFLTAKDEEQDEIAGLTIGADDYIPKPASLNLILAYVKSLLRRRTSEREGSSSNIIQLAGLTIDKESLTVQSSGKNLDLTAKEYSIIELLVQHPKRVFSRQDILEYISEDESFVFDRTVDVHIKNLRLKLGENGAIIKTYRGHGYGIDREIVG
ncbi:MAG: response regulator transcription factor [Balneolales bacterium]|nr:response regulator transcription factor [Balneolales bacterium]